MLTEEKKTNNRVQRLLPRYHPRLSQMRFAICIPAALSWQLKISGKLGAHPAGALVPGLLEAPGGTAGMLPVLAAGKVWGDGGEFHCKLNFKRIYVIKGGLLMEVSARSLWKAIRVWMAGISNSVKCQNRCLMGLWEPGNGQPVLTNQSGTRKGRGRDFPEWEWDVSWNLICLIRF